MKLAAFASHPTPKKSIHRLITAHPPQHSHSHPTLHKLPTTMMRNLVLVALALASSASAFMVPTGGRAFASASQVSSSRAEGKVSEC